MVNYNGTGYSLNYSDGQGYSNPWGLGTHAVKATIMGFETTFNVEITKNPVKKVEVRSISIIEGTSGYKTNEYNSATGKSDLEYYRYSYSPQFTVTLTDGTVLKSNGSMVNYNGKNYWLNYSDDQSYSNPWGVGTHTVKATIIGFETTFNVEITKTPVKKLEVESISIIEGANRQKTNEYNPATGKSDLEYYRYSYSPKFTVTLTNGTVLKSNGNAVNYNGMNYGLNCSDGQSYSNPWGVGTHAVKASIMGFETKFNVEITENPVEKVEVESISIIEGANRHKATEYNPATGKIDLEYYRYSYSPKFTVTLTDGTVLKSNGNAVNYNGTYYGLNRSDGQSYSNPWGVGTHTVKASIMGFETTFNVEITKNPIERVEVENISIIKGTGGYKTTEYNPENGKHDLEYYRYVYSPKFTVTLKDGTVLKSNGSTVNYNDTNYGLNCSDGQSYSNPWGVGTHTVKASIIGFETTFNVEIMESPYKSIEVLKVKPLSEKDCNYSFNGNAYYHSVEFLFRVNNKDGTSFTGLSTTDKNVYITHNQDNEPWTVGGENRFTVHYADLTAEASVEILPSEPFEYIEQNGGLYITGCRIDQEETLEIPSEIDGKPVKGVMSLESYNYSKIRYVKNIIIPDSVVTLGENAFINADNLETITIGSGVNNLDSDMFSYHRLLSNIKVSNNNPYYCDENGIVYNKEKTALVVYPLGKGENYTVPANITDIDVLDKYMYSSLNISFEDQSKAYITEDGITYNSDKTKIISCSKEKSGKYTMPDTVTKICESAFDGCSELTSVTVSQNVAKIVYRTFANCSSLSEIVLPSKLEAIDDRAFSACSQLKTVNLPSSLKTLGAYAFEYSGLESVSMPDSVTNVGTGTFLSCTELAQVSLSNKLKVLSDSMFYRCTALEQITIPESVEEIGYRTFCDTALKSLTIPDNVLSMGGAVFSCCSSLESVFLGKGLKEIPHNAFCGSGLKSIYIPQNILKIGEAAFSDCESLTEAEFTNKDIEIGLYAFSGCAIKELNLPDGIKNSGKPFAFEGNDMSSLSLPNSVTEIAYGNFLSCKNLMEIDIPSSVVRIGGHSFDDTAWYNAQDNGEVYLKHIFYGYKGIMPKNAEISIKSGTTVIADYALDEQQDVKKITLPEGLKAIGVWAFHNCKSIKEIYIPASVSRIETSAFAGCSSLTAINVSPENPYYKSIDGVLFNKDGTELLWCPKREKKRYEVPQSVRSIAGGAFSDSGVTAVKIMNPETELCEYSVGFVSTGSGGSTYNESESESFGFNGIQAGLFAKNLAMEIICPKESKAYNYALENFLAVTVPEDVIIESETDNVEISASSDIVPKNTVINIEIKTTAEVTITDTNTDKYNFDTAIVFDISLEKDGYKIQPNGKITVSIAVPKTLNGSLCRVLYIDSNGKITDMKAVFKEGRMEFETDHFSNYMIAEGDYVVGDINGDGKINNRDAARILQYLAGWDVECNMAALDVNGDGKINNRDAARLLQYLAGWNVEIY